MPNYWAQERDHETNGSTWVDEYESLMLQIIKHSHGDVNYV